MKSFKLNSNSKTYSFLEAIGVTPYWNTELEPWTMCDLASKLAGKIFVAILLTIMATIALYPIGSLLACIVASCQAGFWIGLTENAKFGLVIWGSTVGFIGAGIISTFLRAKIINRSSFRSSGKPSLILEMFRSVKNKTCVKIEITDE